MTATDAANSSGDAGQSATRNPFVEMSSVARASLAFFFLFWRIIPLCAQLTTQIDSNVAFYLVRVICDILTECLLVLPILMPRFLGTRTGWLHPLILPALVSTALGVLRAPQTLLSPFTAWFTPIHEVTHDLFSGHPTEILMQAQAKLSGMTLLSVLSIYIGFAVFRIAQGNGPRSADRQIDATRFLIVLTIFFLIVLFFLQTQGGVLAHMSNLSGGRFRARQLSGPFLVVNAFLPYMLILWYLFRPKSMRNPLFIAGFVLVCILQFIMTGSRSGLFIPFALLLTAWMMVTHKVPAVRILVLAIMSMLLVGVLGELRRSGRDGSVDTTLLRMNLGEARELAEAELEGRSVGADVAVFVAVPRQVDHLWGATYVAAAAFWVPRFIWSGKPRGAGAYTEAMIYRGLDTMDGYEGGGTPSGAVAEAYWNFSVSGVIFVFGLFGGILRVTGDLFARKQADPFLGVVFLAVVFRMSDPSTVKIVGMLQSLAMLGFVWLFITVRRPVRNRGAQETGQGVE